MLCNDRISREDLDLIVRHETRSHINDGLVLIFGCNVRTNEGPQFLTLSASSGSSGRVVVVVVIAVTSARPASAAKERNESLGGRGDGGERTNGREAR